jgi:hypothetical protein
MRIVLFALLLCAACSAQLGPVKCATDDNCEPNAYCSVAGQCAEAALCAGNTAPACAVDAPSGLSAAGGQGQVTLAWNTLGGAQSYVLRRASHTGGPYADLVTQPAAGYLDQGLSPATSYYYVVHAVGPGGPGADSAEAAALTVPATPAHLSATADVGSISLSWDPSAGVTGYRVSRAAADGVFKLLVNAPATPTTYVDSGLAAGASYSYAVAALNASGASARSPIAGATAR